MENNISTYKSIKDWSEDDRPREKLAKYGANNLSNSELLAILIGSGSRGFSAVDAAKDLLESAGSLAELVSFSIEKIKKIKGLGDARAIGLLAAFELSKRIRVANIDTLPILNSPELIAQLFIPRFYGLKQEHFLVILLNPAKRLIKDVIVSKGLVDEVLIHPREVFKPAIEHSASSIILMHNHPSGNPKPSKEDINITYEIVQAGRLLDIPVIDHIIIAGDEFSSFRLLGYIQDEEDRKLKKDINKRN